ncbi:MAG: AAA family ATPase [Hyphomonas sp.]|uniref:AAA family ATPase n=1 Tax=Hyphomonas sp. TaxID=87 RepID=UPI0035275395
MGGRRAIDFGGYVMDVVQARGEGWQEDAYPFNLSAVRSWETLELHEKVTFLVGENGSGKSTLIEAIAIAAGLNAEGGSRDHRFSTQDTHSGLHKFLKLVRGTSRPKDSYFLRAESLYAQASFLDAASTLERYGGRKLHSQSHGESVMALFRNRFGGRGFYVLDEPEAALSPPRQIAFLKRLHELVKEDSQFVIATHSPMILAYPDAWIYEMTPDGPRQVTWDTLEHVRLTRDFLMYPEAYLYEIMEEPGE